MLRPLRGPSLAVYPGRRILLGALVPLALLVLLAILTLRSINRYEAISPPAQPAVRHRARRANSAAQPGGRLADPDFWDGQRGAFDLGCLHIAAGLAFIAVVLAHTVRASARAAGTPVDTPRLGLAALLLGGLVLLGALVFTAADACPTGVPHLLLGLAAAAVGCASWFAAGQPGYPQPFGYLPGLRLITDLTLGGVFCALLLVLLAALAGGWRPGTFVAFGPFVALALGVFALNVVLLSTMTRVASLVAEVSQRANLPNGPTNRTEVFIYPMIGKAVQYLTVLPLALILLFIGYELVTYWRAGADPRERARIRAWYREHLPRPTEEAPWQRSTVEDEPTRPPWASWQCGVFSGGSWSGAVARARRFARMPRDLDKLLTVMAAVGLVLLVTVQIRYWVFHELPWGTQWTFTVGSYLAASIPIVIILVLRKGWRDLHSRRRIGVIWDVLTFWPRAYHPLAPPSYPERAVPELQRRLWRIHDSGGRVVLAAHSQGTVIAAATLLQADSRPADDVVALVTFGSPLRTLYGWAFPAYFGDEVLRQLMPSGSAAPPAAATGPAGARSVYAWRNFYYQTDYIGGAVLAAAPPADVDAELPDPITSWYIFGQPVPPVTRHSGYWADPAVWRTVDQFAATIAAVPQVPGQSAVPAGEGTG